MNNWKLDAICSYFCNCFLGSETGGCLYLRATLPVTSSSTAQYAIGFWNQSIVLTVTRKTLLQVYKKSQLCFEAKNASFVFRVCPFVTPAFCLRLSNKCHQNSDQSLTGRCAFCIPVCMPWLWMKTHAQRADIQLCTPVLLDKYSWIHKRLVMLHVGYHKP